MQQGELDLSGKSTQKEAGPVSIPGFRLVIGYLSDAEEKELLARVDIGPWQTDFKRRIQQYGFGYGQKDKLEWVRDFPDWLKALAERVRGDARFDRLPDNSVINEYIPPQGIGPHRDYPEFGEPIACVSLGSDILTDFAHEEEGLKTAVLVPARSLWMLSGPARWEWTHGIAPRLKDVVRGERRPRSRRVSITFRVTANRADCSF